MPNSISWRKFIKMLRRFGFDGPYSGGRHLFMVKDDLKLHIPNPHKRDISKSLLSEILRQAGMTADDWNEMLNK